MAGLHAYVERAESRPEITAGWAWSRVSRSSGSAPTWRTCPISLRSWHWWSGSNLV